MPTNLISIVISILNISFRPSFRYFFTQCTEFFNKDLNVKTANLFSKLFLQANSEKQTVLKNLLNVISISSHFRINTQNVMYIILYITRIGFYGIFKIFFK